MPEDPTQPTGSGAPRWVKGATLALAAVSLWALGAAWSSGWRAKQVEHSLTSELAAMRQNLEERVELLSRRLTQAEEVNALVQGELSVVTTRLRLTQGELERGRQQAEQIREQYGRQMEEMRHSVSSELAAKASAAEVTTLSGDVSGVRSDLETTKQTLQFARTELGTLIARNHEEVEHLRRRGQRDYFEFTLNRKGGRQRIAAFDLLAELRGTNLQKHQFSVVLHVDETRMEKRDRMMNEPIFFYMHGVRGPVELVINQVEKDRVRGYLSVPKPSPAPLDD